MASTTIPDTTPAAPLVTIKNARWWQRGVLYEIYPRSFLDTDGDGVGDLEGVRRSLDYLEWLGVDAIWIAPFYPSPLKDFGYDISDYTAVDPRFGSLETFDRVLAEAHGRGMRVIIDLVPNHSSDQHPWFIESASSRHNPKRNWYLWADPAPNGGPPNNWLSEFAGSAWEWHAPTGQYYYHAFDVSQPDLNWRNPEVHAAFREIMRFWLKKGVDGFRVDVMWHLLKDAHLRDNPTNPHYDPERESPYHAVLPLHSTDLPEVHDVIVELRRVVDEFDDRLLIGEIYLPISALVSYYGIEHNEAHLPFNFQLVNAPWDAEHIRKVVDEYEASVPAGAWPNWVLGNHDQPRLATRLGEAQARVAAMLLLSVRGTPTLYYGDEIGMTNVVVPPEQAFDPRERRAPGKGLGRDPYRAPMAWDETEHAGFGASKPWLPLVPDWRERNVAAQRAQRDSMLMLYHDLIALRRQEPALSVGMQLTLDLAPPLFGFERRARDSEQRAFAVVLNLSADPQECDMHGRIALSTDRARDATEINGVLRLGPNEGAVIALGDRPLE
jgi:alpha-glucosidase